MPLDYPLKIIKRLQSGSSLDDGGKETSENVIEPAMEMRRGLGDNVSHARHNYRIGIMEGSFTAPANNFLHPELILAGFIYAVTGSALAVALVTVVHKFGTFIPQLIVGTVVEPFPRRRPLYIIGSLIRLFSVMMIGASILLVFHYPGNVSLTFFYGSAFAHAASKGALILIRNDMIGRLIPAHRIGALLGARKLLGGILAITVGALIIQPILNQREIPYNYFILVLIGLSIVLFEHGSWCICKEQSSYSSKHRISMLDALRRGWKWLKEDWNYRCFLWIRISFRFSYVGMAFFIPFGTESLDYSVEGGGLALLGGVLVAVRKISDLLASQVWSRLIDIKGHRKTFIASTFVTVLAPVLALIASHLPPLFELNVPSIAYPVNLPLSVFLGALACLGAGFCGMGLASQQFLITHAPPENRPSYTAFINTLITPLTLLPILGAAMANVFGMNILFYCVAAGAAIGVVSAVSMKKVK